MATQAKTSDTPVIPQDRAEAVLDPATYSDWAGALDQFDWLREHMPVGAHGRQR